MQFAWAGVEPEWAIEQRISQRTAGNIRRLRVEMAAGCIRVEGCTNAYYYKQLALAAVREIFASFPIDLEIIVLGISEPLPHYSRKFADRGVRHIQEGPVSPERAMNSASSVDQA